MTVNTMAIFIFIIPQFVAVFNSRCPKIEEEMGMWLPSPIFSRDADGDIAWHGYNYSVSLGVLGCMQDSFARARTRPKGR